MKAKPLILLGHARRDVEGAIDFYVDEAGAAVARRFRAALTLALGSIGRHPATGSLRYAHELNLPGLRSRRVRRFPYLIFYVELAERVEVWRVLHAHRDIPAWFHS